MFSGGDGARGRSSESALNQRFALVQPVRKAEQFPSRPVPLLSNLSGYFARRFSSRSTASRMKSERLSPSAHAASIRASVPAGKRAGVCSSLIFGRPTPERVGDITF